MIFKKWTFKKIIIKKPTPQNNIHLKLSDLIK